MEERTQVEGLAFLRRWRVQQAEAEDAEQHGTDRAGQKILKLADQPIPSDDESGSDPADRFPRRESLETRRGAGCV